MRSSSRKTQVISCSIFVSFTFLCCTELKEGLSKAVFIEYEQSLNFREYQFGETILAPGPSSDLEWHKIRINDYSGGKSKKGVWILYQICSIRNNNTKAQPFNYDVSKFYVIYGDQQFYYRPLAAYTYENVLLSGIKGNDAVTAVLAPVFRTETQTGPDQQVIPANSNNTLSVSWRFVIYVSTALSDQTDMLRLNLSLYYDGTPVTTMNRNQDTAPHDGTVTRGTLPVVCRPPKT